MNKKRIAALAVVALTLGGAVVYAQNENENAPTPIETVNKEVGQNVTSEKVKLTKDEYERMVKIILKVNRGELPESALEEAKPLLELHPEYRNDLTNKNENAPTPIETVNKEVGQNVTFEKVKLTKDEYERMVKIILKVNRGELPESALEEAKPLLELHPEYRND